MSLLVRKVSVLGSDSFANAFANEEYNNGIGSFAEDDNSLVSCGSVSLASLMSSINDDQDIMSVPSILEENSIVEAAGLVVPADNDSIIEGNSIIEDPNNNDIILVDLNPPESVAMAHNYDDDGNVSVGSSLSDLDDDMEYMSADVSPRTHAEPVQELRYNATDSTCPLCLCGVEGGEAVVLPACHHAICITCIQSHFKMHELLARSSSMPRMCCPKQAADICKTPLTELLVSQIMEIELPSSITMKDNSANEQTSFTQHSSGSTKTNPNSYHRCPTLGCCNLVYWKEGNGPPIGDCFACNRTSCLKCGATPYHNGKSCEDYQMDGLLGGGAEEESRHDGEQRLSGPPLLPNLVMEERGDKSSRRGSR